MSFSMKPKRTGGAGDGIDWKKINEQIEDGPQPGVVSLLINLGKQERGKGVAYEGEDKFTVVDSEEDAQKLLSQAEDIIGTKIIEKYNLDDADPQEGGKLRLNFKIYDKDPAEEIAIFVDLPDTQIEYIEGEDPKQYRLMLNPHFKGDLRGFAFVAAPPKDGSNVWTFAPNSRLAELAKSTRQPEILNGSEETNMDIGRVLGKPLLINIEKTDKGFIKAGKTMPLMKGMKVGSIDCGDGEGVGITFENATVELLEQAQLRKYVFDKIKKALDYEGSNMQKAVEAFEAKHSSNKEDSSDNKVAKSEETKKQPPKKEDKDIDKFDDDIPF